MRSDHSDRDKSDRIERLRKRLREAQQSGNTQRELPNILQGILDLLADELGNGTRSSD